MPARVIAQMAAYTLTAWNLSRIETMGEDRGGRGGWRRAQLSHSPNVSQGIKTFHWCSVLRLQQENCMCIHYRTYVTNWWNCIMRLCRPRHYYGGGMCPGPGPKRPCVCVPRWVPSVSMPSDISDVSLTFVTFQHATIKVYSCSLRLSVSLHFLGVRFSFFCFVLGLPFHFVRSQFNFVKWRHINSFEPPVPANSRYIAHTVGSNTCMSSKRYESENPRKLIGDMVAFLVRVTVRAAVVVACIAHISVAFHSRIGGDSWRSYHSYRAFSLRAPLRHRNLLSPLTEYRPTKVCGPKRHLKQCGAFPWRL